MPTLLLAEHDNATLKDATAKALTQPAELLTNDSISPLFMAAIEAAEEWFKSPEAKTELAQAEYRNEPPPSPKKDGSPWFSVDLPDEAQHTYSWVELGKSERLLLGLSNTAGKNASPGSLWKLAEEARKKGEALVKTGGSGKTIGDELSAANVSWAWYSGGWSNADGDVGAVAADALFEGRTHSQ